MLLALNWHQFPNHILFYSSIILVLVFLHTQIITDTTVNSPLLSFYFVSECHWHFCFTLLVNSHPGSTKLSVFSNFVLTQVGHTWSKLQNHVAWLQFKHMISNVRWTLDTTQKPFKKSFNSFLFKLPNTWSCFKLFLLILSWWFLSYSFQFQFLTQW